MLRLAALLALAPLTGCATVLGTAISPITVPIDYVREASAGSVKWAAFPIAILLSPLFGLFCGLETDSRLIDPGWEWPLHQILRPIYYMPGH